MAKCLLRLKVQGAQATRGTDQLARAVEAGIEGGIHAMRVLWEEHSLEEDWRFLLIDA